MALKKVNQTVWKKTKFKPEEARKQLDKMGPDARFIYARVLGELMEPDVAATVAKMSLLKIAEILRITADSYENTHYIEVTKKRGETMMRFATGAKARIAAATTTTTTVN